MRTPATLLTLTTLVLGSCSTVRAQPLLLTAYVQTIPLVSDATPLTDSTVNSFNRFRLTTESTLNDLSLEVAYEHAALLRQRDMPTTFGIGTVQGEGEWLDLQWVISEEDHVLWSHRFDRLRVGWSPTAGVELSAGRQALSWGTTLFLTPADPFLPFNPADPFREFRAGVDAARIRISPSPLSEIDLVLRPTKTHSRDEFTALGRGLITIKNWEVSGWAGSLYGDAAGAVAAAGALGALAVRGEMTVRQIADSVAFRSAVGMDRLLQVGGRDLFVLVEYQHDGLGAAGAGEYVNVLLSEPFTRGELQVLGRDETAVQASYQLHPLWGVSGLWLWNLNDRSALLSPSLSYSASNEAAVAAGLMFGLGSDKMTVKLPVPSEYGLGSVTAYLSVSWFF